MKLNLPIVPFILTLFVACNQENEKNTSVETEEKQEEAVLIEEKESAITSFKGFPAEIEGCSCYFGEDSNAVINKNFYFVSSYDSIAFIAYKEKKIRLDLLESGRSITEYGDTDQKNIYAKDSLRLEISWEFQNKTGYESWWNKAEMTVFSNDKEVFSKNLVGECGC